MGTWGVGAFQVDQAHDWLLDLRDGAEGAGAIRRLFDEVLAAPADEYLELDVGAAVRAAAELVAAANGHPPADLPQTAREVLAPIAAAVRAARDLPERAARAVARVTTSPATSELQDLWLEGGDDPEWSAAVADLTARLAASGAG